jgi:hypothetical protein
MKQYGKWTSYYETMAQTVSLTTQKEVIFKQLANPRGKRSVCFGIFYICKTKLRGFLHH